jgi:hypothetical protein
MALDLFANFERASNNSLFYRSVSSVPHEVLFRLVEGERYGVDLIDSYQAEYSLNGSARAPMIDLQSCQLFNRQTPATYSFVVYVSSLDPLQYVGSYTLAAKYVSSLPEANFVVYPTYRIDEASGTMLILNSTNYQQTSGAYFYGEGHTEPVNLSANYSTANWFVGNQLSAIEGQQSNAPITVTGGQTATASITSSPALEKTYQVSLRVTNSDIQLAGPIYTYNDATGVRSFYPFFCSTLHISNSASELNNLLRSPIEIKAYPIVQNYDLISQLSGSPISLPYNFGPRRFLARISSNENSLPFLSEPFYATQWELESVADTQEPNPDWSNTTVLYPSVTGYSFPLSYYNQNNINDFLFKCSAGFDTTVTTTVSVYKSMIIDLPPNDWLCRTVSLVLNDQEVVAGMPVGRFYTSSYYYLTGEEIKLHNITLSSSNITLTNVVLSSERLSEAIVFGVNDKYKRVVFDSIGVVTLSATINFTDQNSFAHSITTILENFIEIVPFYDQVEEGSYRAMESSPSSLSGEHPRISPNEWVTENNINSVFYKFDQSLNELRTFARQYNTTNPIIGRLEPTSDCNRAPYWLVPTIEPNKFNRLLCINGYEGCKYTGIARLNSEDKIIVAYKSELHLLENNYEASLLRKHYHVDDVFTFIDVVGIASTSDDRVVVLDSTISRVSVFSINPTNYEFVLFTTWGRYGLSNSKTGFNKPQDLHVDGSNNVWICDTGNECVKKLTLTGRHIMTVQNAVFEDNAPISICVDSDNNLHCLAEDSKVYVFDSQGAFAFSYSLPKGIVGIKINCSYETKETIHITYNNGILKYFKNGVFSHYIIEDKSCIPFPFFSAKWVNHKCSGNNPDAYNWQRKFCWNQLRECVESEETYYESTFNLSSFENITHDRYRNLYVTLNNVILKIIDRMTIDEVSYESYAGENLWSLDSILIDKEEYIQPWVYLRSFHRMWDNIELFRNSLFYEIQGCKSFALPLYDKEDLKLGQNEIVTNAVINRLSEQLWTNLQSIAKYFDSTCKN